MSPVSCWWQFVRPRHVGLGVVHVRPRVRHTGWRRAIRPRGIWQWTCAAGPPVFAIPPLAWVWHPPIAPIPPIAPPSDTGDTGGYDTFWPGGNGLGAGLPSGEGVLIPAAFAGSPSLVNAPPNLTGSACCVVAQGRSAVSEPAVVWMLGAALLITFLADRLSRCRRRAAR